MNGWGDPRPVLDEEPVASYTAERRARLAQALPAELLVIPSGAQQVRSNDSNHAFRPGTDHVWLSGNRGASSVLVIDTTGGVADGILYLQPPSGRTTDEFWQNDADGDLWVGPRPSLRETEELLGIECRPLGSLPDDLARMMRNAQTVRVLPTLDPAVDALVQTHCGSQLEPHLRLKAALDELRLIKSDWEINQLQQAVDGTVAGFRDCAAAWQEARRSSRGERYLEGTFARRARLEGEGPAYGSVVGGGAHATTLHWSDNSGRLNDGDLVLIDVGVEMRSLYSADITRTLPVDGVLTPLQRDIYSIVLRAQDAGIGALRAGVPFQDYQDACASSLTADLIDLGLIGCTLEEAMKPDAQYHRRWSISRSGHMLGMDVHDCNHAPTASYLHGPLAAGHTLTVEPGLYFQENDLTIPSELRGIGIRIEDDLVVTETASINMSAALPREVAEVEAWMNELAT